MNGLTVLLANPGAVVRQGAGVVEITSSPESAAPAGSEATGRGSLPVEPRPDSVTIRVRLDGEEVVEVVAARDVTTSHELFFVARPDGEVILTDHFRCALARIPLAERDVPDASVADHMLFRTTPGSNTYVSGVHRIAHGEAVRWARDPGERRATRVDRLARTSVHETMDEQLGAIESALGGALRPVADGADRLVNMLSGGIDSTLIHSFLGSSVPSISTGIDSPEFSFEMEYARQASRLLGTSHAFLPVREDEYLARLERSIEVLGLPPQHLQTVLLDAAFQSDHGQYVTGQLADAVFGLESSILGWRAWHLRGVLRSPAGVLLSRLGAGMRRRHERLEGACAQVTRSPEDPDGYAMRYAVYSDVDGVRELLGERLVEERLQARLEYLRAVAELPERRGTGLAAHLELGHWIDFYCDDTVSLWRQLAHGRGKSLFAPFTSRSVAESALAVPTDERYIRRGNPKHLLKSLLRRRVPAYPVNQPKGGSGLPFLRYIRTGPLRDALLEYPLPAFVGAAQREALLRAPSWITWNVLTYAIWSERVLRNAAINPPPHLRELRWPVRKREHLLR